MNADLLDSARFAGDGQWSATEGISHPQQGARRHLLPEEKPFPTEVFGGNRFGNMAGTWLNPRLIQKKGLQRFQHKG